LRGRRLSDSGNSNDLADCQQAPKTKVVSEKPSADIILNADRLFDW
jgi:hypothetical protein